MITNDKLLALKQALGPKVKEQVMLGPYTTLKIGGPADLFIEAASVSEVVRFALEARKVAVPYFVLGGGSNILIGDKGVRGLVIKNNSQQITIKGMKGNASSGIVERQVFVEADTGVSINKLVRFTVEEGLAGLEMHLGLPGTVGGAIFMNSKWTNPTGYVGDVVYQATILTPKGTIESVPKTYFQFGYDTSSIQKTHDIVLTVVFSLTSFSKEALWERANASIGYRRESQPQGIKSAGCTFKNISMATAIAHAVPNSCTSAGFLVDHIGLKGLTAGGAMISPQHANFIVNTGKATAKDVIQLIETARQKVREQFGVVLEEEIVRVGEF